MPIETLPKVEAPKLTPGISKELPSEVANTQFSVDDFDVQQLPEQGAKEEGAEKEVVKEEKPITPPAKEEPKVEAKEEVKEEEEEVEEKKEEKKLPSFFKKPGEKKETAKESEKKEEKPIIPTNKVTRDYTGYTAEQVEAFKQMSDKAYKLTTDLIKQNKELNEKATSNIMQHPQAYVLDPQYQEERNGLYFANTEANYWMEQLAKMDSGEDLIPLKGFDKKTGAPVLGEPMKSSKMLEEQVRGIIYECNQKAAQLKTKLQEYPSKYQSNIKADTARIDEYRKKNFGWVTDEALMDYEIPIEGLGERSLKQIKEDVNAMIPQWLHSSPLAPVLADVVIALRIKQAELLEAQQALNVTQTKKSEQELVEPSGHDKPRSKGKSEKVHGVEEFSALPELGI